MVKGTTLPDGSRRNPLKFAPVSHCPTMIPPCGGGCKGLIEAGAIEGCKVSGVIGSKRMSQIATVGVDPYNFSEGSDGGRKRAGRTGNSNDVILPSSSRRNPWWTPDDM